MSVFLAEKRTYARRARRGLIYDDIPRPAATRLW